MVGRPSNPERGPKRRGTRAGLHLEASRIKKSMRAGNYSRKYGGNTDLYLAGIVEYIVSEILSGAGMIAKESKRNRLTPRAIQLCIQNDEDLAAFFKGRTIRQGGVVPYINERLLPKKRKTAK